MWERRLGDSDFCCVRTALGTQPLATRLIGPAMETARRPDPVTASAVERFLQTHSTIPDAPIVVGLLGVAAVTVTGGPSQVRALVRAMICELAVLHTPHVVQIAAVVSDRTRPHWDWLKWLPHNRHPRATDDVGPSRMVYPSLAAAEKALASVQADDLTAPLRQLLIVVDGAPRDEVTLGGVTLLIVKIDDSAKAAELRLRLGDQEPVTVGARPDQMSEIAALACAQRLAGYRIGRLGASAAERGSGARWQDLVGIRDLASYRLPEYWEGRGSRDRLRVPIGTTVDGEPLHLDIKEPAESGMGPHGLCIGATGSGKSEFLRTVALGMMACHSPEMLNLVLIDFKGGATFSELGVAPHVAAVITNLADKAVLVARMRDALTGEMTRRQELLRAAGNLDGIAAHERKRRAGAQLAPLPALFIIVDEFSELLSQQPDFAEVFVAIGRLGRSLGMHLLLASQRLDEGRLRGLESHLSYRICLKTLSAQESRVVLGTSDAYELPSTPGAAYLRAGSDELIRFQTAYVSGSSGVETHRAAEEVERRDALVHVFNTNQVGPLKLARGVQTDVVDRSSVLSTVIDRLAGHGPRAHEVWLPPLGAAPSLDVIIENAKPMSPLTVPIGVVDRPFEQRRTSLVVDLSGAAGNVAVVGAPQSGKSTTVRTLITALAVTHDPDVVQFYCLDFGGGALTSLRGWPHVGAVAGRADSEMAQRMVARIETIIRSRETLFRDHGIDSMAEYRRLKTRRDPLCDRFGDVFLVVDGWSGVRREFDMIEESITAIAAQGLSFGVHVVMSASRWAEIRPALRDQVGTRIELRLGDPAESELDRRRAQQVPEGTPGRGLTPDALHMLVAVPRLDGVDSNSGLTEASVRLGKMLRSRHGEQKAPGIPLLPSLIDHDSLIERNDTSQPLPVVGLEEAELRTLAIDFAEQHHLLILGDTECGKTATLRLVCRELLRTTAPAECLVFVVDFRRSLFDVIDPESEQLGGYFASADAVSQAIPQLTERLLRRMPSSNTTASQLRARSWWSGPELYLVIDDYDLVGHSGSNPLTRLMEFLPYATDLGLHFVVARRSSGAARAMFEPLLAGLRDVGCTTLVMSGSPDDGLAIGPVRPSPMPPGRGTLITRRGSPQVVQVAWSPRS
jgi:DNA segregation ATPase FtsK/SpoIIIE, S-DNA-T family